jgi:hypothetical protein
LTPKVFTQPTKGVGVFVNDTDLMPFGIQPAICISYRNSVAKT